MDSELVDKVNRERDGHYLDAITDVQEGRKECVVADQLAADAYPHRSRKIDMLRRVVNEMVDPQPAHFVLAKMLNVVEELDMQVLSK